MAEKEYIERDKIGLTDFEIILCNGDYKEALKMLLDKISSLPAADVRPVKWGRWENTGSDVWKCSACGYGIMPWNAGVNFCPNCGADMRGEQDG